MCKIVKGDAMDEPTHLDLGRAMGITVVIMVSAFALALSGYM
jgi:hypothetical protein